MLYIFSTVFHIYTVGTHSVIGINVSTASGTEIKWIFNAGSYAIGCLINLTNMANGITYCIASQRFSNLSLSAFPMFQLCNLTVDAGRYLLTVYDIERDGKISTLPAVIEEVQLLGTFATIYETSNSRKCICHAIIYPVSVGNVLITTFPSFLLHQCTLLHLTHY